MGKLKKIDTSQIKNQVYESCKKMIVNGSWKPGTKLPSESQLCEELGVSRVSIRSALQALEARGFIDIRRGEGSFVNHFNLADHLKLLVPVFALERSDVMEVIEYRLIVEPNIMPLVIERASEEDIKSLEKIYKQMEESVDDIRKFATLDEQFHLRLVDIISNNVIQRIYTVLFEIFNSSWLEICEVLGVKDGLFYHLEMINAIRNRKIDEAVAIMYKHVERTHSRMIDYYKSKENT